MKELKCWINMFILYRILHAGGFTFARLIINDTLPTTKSSA